MRPLNRRSERHRDMMNGVVTCLRVRRWFRRARTVIRLKLKPATANTEEKVPAKVESKYEKTKSGEVEALAAPGSRKQDRLGDAAESILTSISRPSGVVSIMDGLGVQSLFGV